MRRILFVVAVLLSTASVSRGQTLNLPSLDTLNSWSVTGTLVYVEPVGTGPDRVFLYIHVGGAISREDCEALNEDSPELCPIIECAEARIEDCLAATAEFCYSLRGSVQGTAGQAIINKLNRIATVPCGQ